MNVLYLIRYEVDGKRYKKSTWLPNKAKDARCNKTLVKHRVKGLCAKVKYKMDGSIKEKLVPLPEGAEIVSITQCRKTGRIGPTRMKYW
jgi:hypothetical protein